MTIIHTLIPAFHARGAFPDLSARQPGRAAFPRGNNFVVTQEQVLAELNKTGDPELGIGIVDLGLVAECIVQGDYVKIAIRTTTPRCPFQPFIMMEAHRKLLQLNGIRGAEVEIRNEPPWHPEMMTDIARERLGFNPSRLDAHLVPEILVGAKDR
jgi:metal-sulfur cluster biosynthetic enzyme